MQTLIILIALVTAAWFSILLARYGQSRVGCRLRCAQASRSREYLRAIVASPVKIAKIREYGAQLQIVGDRYADALAASRSWITKSGAMEIHAYDSMETPLGQATLALELERQAPDVDTVLIAVGGGGVDRWRRGLFRTTSRHSRRGGNWRGAGICTYSYICPAGGSAGR